MSNEEIKRAILEMDEREELAKDMLEQVRRSASGIIMCIQEKEKDSSITTIWVGINRYD